MARKKTPTPDTDDLLGTYAYTHRGYACTATVTATTPTRVKGTLRKVRGGSDLTEDFDWTRAEWERVVPVGAKVEDA